MLIIDGEWLDEHLGEPQLKGFAEALRMKIRVYDARDLDAAPIEFRPEPEYFEDPYQSNSERVRLKKGSKPTAKLLLYREHYYPLFRKGKFPNFGLGKERDNIESRIVVGPQPDFKDHSQVGDLVSQKFPISTTISLESTAGGGTEGEGCFQNLVADDEGWEYVKNAQFGNFGVGTGSTENTFPPSELAISPKTPSTDLISNEKSHSQDMFVVPRNDNSKVDESTSRQSEPQLTSPQIPVTLENSIAEKTGNPTKVLAALGIGVSLGFLGKVVIDFLFRKSLRKKKNEGKMKLKNLDDEVAAVRW